MGEARAKNFSRLFFKPRGGGRRGLFFFLGLFLGLLLAGGCVFIPPPTGNETASLNYDEIRGKRSNGAAEESAALGAGAIGQASSGERSYRRPRRKTLESANPCERESESHKCRKLCAKIYEWRSHRASCRKLDPKQIEKLDDLYKTLRVPEEEELEDIDLEDLEIYLSVAADSFLRLTGRYNQTEAREFLRWIAKDQEAAEAIAGWDEDEGYVFLHSLLEALSPRWAWPPRSESGYSFIRSSSEQASAPYVPFRAALDEDGKKFLMKEALDSGNETAAEWFYDYIMEKTPDCRGDSSRSRENCFAYFCEIGVSMQLRHRREWRELDFFESYLEEAVSKKTNGGSLSDQWDSSEIESLADIDDWFADLKCDELLECEPDFKNYPSISGC